METRPPLLFFCVLDRFVWCITTFCDPLSIPFGPGYTISAVSSLLIPYGFISGRPLQASALVFWCSLHFTPKGLKFCYPDYSEASVCQSAVCTFLTICANSGELFIPCYDFRARFHFMHCCIGLHHYLFTINTVYLAFSSLA